MEKRKNALWVRNYYRWLVHTLAQENDGDSAGRFTERALDEYIERNYPERRQEFYIKRKEFDEMVKKVNEDD